MFEFEISALELVEWYNRVSRTARGCTNVPPASLRDILIKKTKLPFSNRMGHAYLKERVRSVIAAWQNLLITIKY